MWNGDSKSYNRVKGVYEDAGIEVEKKECIGHVQKRVMCKDNFSGLYSIPSIFEVRYLCMFLHSMN